MVTSRSPRAPRGPPFNATPRRTSRAGVDFGIESLGSGRNTASGSPQVPLPSHVSGGSAVEELIFALENQNTVVLVDAEGNQTVLQAKQVWTDAEDLNEATSVKIVVSCGQ